MSTLNINQLIHIWAQNETRDKRCGNVFIRDYVLYSYGEHYPLGLFIKHKKQRLCFINENGYSTSTAKHTSWVRNAVTGTYTAIESTETMKRLVMWKNDPVQIRSIIKDYITRRVGRLDVKLKSGIKSKSAALKFTQELENELLQLERLAKTFNIPTKRLFNKLYGERLDKLNEMAKQWAVKREARRSEAEALDARLNSIAARYVDNYITAWKSGSVEDLQLVCVTIEQAGVSRGRVMAQIKHSLLRVTPDGDEIETSHGARVPYSHGKRAYTLWHAVAVSKLTRFDYVVEHAKQIGHFKINSINADGDVVIGCHKLTGAEIEDFAKRVGWEA